MNIRKTPFPHFKIYRTGTHSIAVEEAIIQTEIDGNFTVDAKEFENIAFGPLNDFGDATARSYVVAVKMVWRVTRSGSLKLDSNLPNEGYGGARGRLRTWTYEPQLFEFVLGQDAGQLQTPEDEALQVSRAWLVDDVWEHINYFKIANITALKDSLSITSDGYTPSPENQTLELPRVRQYVFNGALD